jgi:hypothetical protein
MASTRSRASSPMERYEMDLLGAQETGLPASPYLDATPTGEVQVRVRTENARMLKENRQSIDFRPDDTRQRLDNVYQGERPDVAARSIENRNEPAYVESATARHQRSWKGRYSHIYTFRFY